MAAGKKSKTRGAKAKSAPKRPAKGKASRKPAKSGAKRAGAKAGKPAARAPETKSKDTVSSGTQFPVMQTVPKTERSRGSKPITLHHVKPSKTQLKDFERKLLDRRRQLLGDVQQMEGEALSDSARATSTNHIADSSADQYEQDFTLHIMENETSDLRMIELALNKMKDPVANGEFGRCENCGIWISIERLRAKPYSRLCIHCIEAFERDGGGEKFGITPPEKF